MWRSAGARHGLVMAAAMGLAGGLDYGVNVLAGRRLDPVQFGTFISVSALLQVLLMLSIAIRTIVAVHTAELTAGPDATARAGRFAGAAWRWAWRWGLAASVLMALASPVVARALRLPATWPILAASPMVLALFVREAAFGTLQGIQSFESLGLVQVAQAVLRFALVAALVATGAGATGAIAAQPLAAFACIALAAWPLRQLLRGGGAPEVGRRVDWQASAHTLVGLAAFGAVTNLDALFVGRVMGPEIAGQYAPVVTLAKACLFLPWAVGLVLLPKVAQRRAAGRDPRPVLHAALAAALAPGLAVAALCFVAPGPIVTTVFGGAYRDPGVVLGLATLAATLHAGVHVWWNYALSLGRTRFAFALVAVFAGQASGMLLLGRGDLVHMALVMVAAGVLGNVAGHAATSSAAVAAKPAGHPAIAGGG